MGAQFFTDYQPMPWPNGMGITYEVVRAPESGDFDWRISLADIDNDCPFSVLEGIDRWIVLMEGDYMVLKNETDEHKIVEDAPFFYPGEIAFDCTLGGGPARDLNIMTRRGKTDSHVEVFSAGEHVIDASADTHIIVALKGATTVEGTEMKLRDAAVITGSQTVKTTGTFAHIALKSL